MQLFFETSLYPFLPTQSAYLRGMYLHSLVMVVWLNDPPNTLDGLGAYHYL